MYTLVKPMAQAALLFISLLSAQWAQAGFVNINLDGSSNINVFSDDQGQRLDGRMVGMQANTYQVSITETGLYSFDLWDVRNDNRYFERAGAFLTSDSALLTSVSLNNRSETRKGSEFLVEAGSYYLTLWGVSESVDVLYSFELSLLESTSQVPVPPAAILFGSGLMALFAYGRRKTKQ